LLELTTVTPLDNDIGQLRNFRYKQRHREETACEI